MSLFTADQVEAEILTGYQQTVLSQRQIEELTDEEYAAFLAGYLIYDA